MTPRRTVLVAYLVLAPLTVLGFGAVLVVTAFVACGISGCSGGGFGPSFSPVQAQVGLLACGATLLPLSLVVLRRQPLVHRALGGFAVVLAGSLLAVAVSGIGPNGCPLGQQRAVVGAQDYDAGAATCSADRDAVPAGDG